ncbi:hypothetical protein GGR40_002161 [Novosphingobium gossypii]
MGLHPAREGLSDALTDVGKDRNLHAAMEPCGVSAASSWRITRAVLA